jgi:hypothetical protein
MGTVFIHWDPRFFPLVNLCPIAATATIQIVIDLKERTKLCFILAVPPSLLLIIGSLLMPPLVVLQEVSDMTRGVLRNVEMAAPGAHLARLGIAYELGLGLELGLPRHQV